MIQSLEPAVKLIQTRVKESTKAGWKELAVGSVFRMLRDNSGFSFFGDYPLLALATDEIQKAGFAVRRNALFKVMRQSDELSWLSQKDRTTLVDQLLDTPLLTSKGNLCLET